MVKSIRRFGALFALLVAACLGACDNNPWPARSAESNVLRTAVIESSPRHLDPTASYWANDTPYTYQIYEPPYGYHYLKRPFVLVPKTAEAVAVPTYLDKDGKPLPADAPGAQVAESVYDVRIKPGILFQPHPAFARDAQGNYRYHALKAGELGRRDHTHDAARRPRQDCVAPLERAGRLQAPCRRHKEEAASAFSVLGRGRGRARDEVCGRDFTACPHPYPPPARGRGIGLSGHQPRAHPLHIAPQHRRQIRIHHRRVAPRHDADQPRNLMADRHLCEACRAREFCRRPLVARKRGCVHEYNRC